MKTENFYKNDLVIVNLLVVLRGELPGGWVEGFSRLYWLLEGVDSLGEQGLLSHHIPTPNDQAKVVCQLKWYWAHFLLTEKRLGIRELSNVFKVLIW